MNLLKTSAPDEKYVGGSNFFVFMFFLILIFLIYSNTFSNSWHFDDLPNITLNKRIHIEKLDIESLCKSFYFSYGQKSELVKQISRPFSYFTFALNWYFGQNKTAGYHFINILIHVFTSFFLFLSIKLLLSTPNIKIKEKDRYFIAFLGSALWAANPIQTQAVTYIVQRMASMAAMFYIISIYGYLKVRLFEQINAAWILLPVVAFFLASFSKENAIMLPLSLVLIEMIFFGKQSIWFNISKKNRIAVLALLILSGIIVIFVLNIDFMSVLNGYDNRPFTMWQRIVTEPAIIIFYLSLIFYPIPSRLSICHDFSLPDSLFSYFVMMPSILLIILVIWAGFVRFKKYPLISFAILFYLLNHLIESTIIPLELVYEHRNYLPSLFLFVPFAFYFKKAIGYYKRQNMFMVKILICFIVLIVVGFGCGTYIRNFDWRTEKSLWEDAAKKTINSDKPIQMLASISEKEKKYNDALALYEKALKMSSQQQKQSKIVCYNNMGNIFLKQKKYDKAKQYFDKVLKINPDYNRALYNKTFVLIEEGNLEDALENINYLIKLEKDNINLLNLKGHILLRGKKYKQVFNVYKKAFNLDSFSTQGMINLSVALILNQHYRRAQWFLKIVYTKTPKDLKVIVLLIDSSLKLNNNVMADKYVNVLLTLAPIKKVKETVNLMIYSGLLTEGSSKNIKFVIKRRIKQISDEIRKLAYSSNQDKSMEVSVKMS